MNKFLSLAFSFFALILLSCNVHAQAPDIEDYETIPAKPNINIFSLFKLNASEDSSGFISLSEIYPLNDDTAALSIPNMTEKGEFEAEKYTLEGSYRKRLLSKTGISEKDFVFIYDYVHNKLTTFAVKNLKVIAIRSIYAPTDEGLARYDWYMIGFEINQKILKTLKSDPWNLLVYIGKKSPFAQEQLTPLVWNKIPSREFPATTETQDKKAFLHLEYYRSLPYGNTYLAETNGFQYYLQDYIQDNITLARRLLVVEPQTQEIIIDKVFRKSQYISLYPLNYQENVNEVYQWTGKLFGDKPPVIFGFASSLFGCPYLSIIDKSHEEIPIYCDNRH